MQRRSKHGVPSIASPWRARREIHVPTLTPEYRVRLPVPGTVRMPRVRALGVFLTKFSTLKM